MSEWERKKKKKRRQRKKRKKFDFVQTYFADILRENSFETEDFYISD